MRDKEKDAAQMAQKRQTMLEKGFLLFSQRSIDAVSMPDIAKECGYGIATLYRYFSTKMDLVVAIATWKWQEFFKENDIRRASAKLEEKSAAKQYEYVLDNFLELYHNHGDLLRFNQAFNLYVKGQTDSVEMEQYIKLTDYITGNFHETYQKAKKDKTLRTDISEEEIIFSTMHLMLAAITRYAVGLVYVPKKGLSPDEELILLKRMLLREYTSCITKKPAN